ncbi:MAG: WbqC family protein, partial [Candidatus Roizmanbacteria bacterium]
MKKIKINKNNISIAVHQPGYHRYVGFFYKIWLTDIFISFDIVQYVSREFQNRQKFFYNNKMNWLTIPVHAGREEIYKKKIVDPNILKNH